MEGNLILLFIVVFPIVGGILTYFIGRKNKNVRDLFSNMITMIEFIVFLFIFIFIDYSHGISFTLKNFCGMGIHLGLDGFRVLYGLVASFMWMMTTIFSQEYFKHYRNRNRYHFFTLLTLGATVGVFLSTDLYTNFIFFEMLSFTSYVWVAHDERKESLKAAETYLAVSIIGGLVILMGLFLLYASIGTLTISDLLSACSSYPDKKRLYIAGGCILFGFGAKAGAFPLHVWLPKAHSVAPAPGSALLSGILTKAGVFGILVISCNIFLYDAVWGHWVLYIGVITMIVGSILAVFSIDLKRTLACSSISQIGFILIGIGMQCILGEENAQAIRGTLLHMVNHSLIKLVLFMAAGIVAMNLHKLDLNDIKGFGRKKPLLNISFLMGALGISGIPLLNGYVSKTLLHESIVEGMEVLSFGKAIEWIFIIGGGLTVAYMTKLYVAIFVEKNDDDRVQIEFYKLHSNYMNKRSAFALLGSAVLLPIMGLFPNIVMDRIADLGQGFMHLEESPHAVEYFNIVNLKGTIISIVIGGLIYMGVIRKFLLTNRWPKKLDMEERIYRPLLLNVLGIGFACIFRVLDRLLDDIVVLLRKTFYRDSKIPCELEEGTIVTHIIGHFLDCIVTLWNKTLGKNKPIICEHTYEHKFALRREVIRESNFIIARSLSFGLFLSCVGFLLTLIYLIIR